MRPKKEGCGASSFAGRLIEQGKRWRIPAVEIENAVLVALGSFLDEHSALIAILSLRRLPPAQTASVLKQRRPCRVRYHKTMSVSCARHSNQSCRASRSEIQKSPLPSSCDGSAKSSSCRCFLPTSLAPMPSLCPCASRSGGLSRTDHRRWRYGDACKRRGSSEGSRASLFVVRRHPHAACQRCVGTCRSRAAHSVYVQAHLPLAFLAPSIIGAILEGRQPADLSLKQLMYRTDLAASWNSQRQQLGIET